MAMRGERFELDLDPEEAYEQYLQQQAGNVSSSTKSSDQAAPTASPASFTPFVKDVLEHSPSTPPTAPSMKQQGARGFPAHRKRVPRPKQNQTATNTSISPGVTKVSAASNLKPGAYLSHLSNASAAEKQDIDRQTTAMIDSMSADELREARQELLADPSFASIQKLLNRASIDTDSTEDPVPRSKNADKGNVKKAGSKDDQAPPKQVSFAPEAEKGRRELYANIQTKNPTAVPIFKPEDIKPISTSRATYRTPFYQSKYNETSLKDAAAEAAAQMRAELGEQSASRGQLASSEPEATDNSKPKTIHSNPLDINSDSFMKDLHETYYPDLPVDTRSLEWMKAIAPNEGPVEPTSAIPPAKLRFDFRGSIISPTRSAAIPVNQGLHHHGRDPDSAGYTIEELAIYERSTVAGQRCFAYQLLGRILYRLGIGEFRLDRKRREEQQADSTPKEVETIQQAGIVNDLPPDTREDGLWQEIRKYHVVEQLLAEAAREPGSGSESARVWALEGIWLWRKGGGRGFEDGGGDEGPGAHDHEDEVMGEAAGQILAEGLNPQ